MELASNVPVFLIPGLLLLISGEHGNGRHEKGQRL